MPWERRAVKSSRFFLQGNRTRPSYLAHSSRYPRPLHLPSTNGISRAYASSNHQCGNCRADGTECGLVVWFRHSRQRPQLHRLQPQRTGRRKRLARLHRLPVQDRRRLPPGPPRHRRGLRGGHPGVPPAGPRSHHRQPPDQRPGLPPHRPAGRGHRPLAAGRTPLPGARTRVGDEARHLRVPHGYGPALDGEEPCTDVPPLVHEALFEDAAPDVLAADDADEATDGPAEPIDEPEAAEDETVTEVVAAPSPSRGRRRKRQHPRVGRQPSSRRMRSSPPR